MRKGNLDIIPTFQSLGDDIGHLVIGARIGTERLEQNQARHFFRKGAGIKQAHASTQGRAEKGDGLLFEMPEQAGQVSEKIFMLVTAARARPCTVAVSAQVEGHSVLDRYPPRYQRFEKVIPTTPLVTHSMHKDISVFSWISPLPIVKLQTIMNKIALPW